ncbi:MAG: tetratricopeptide repeat protein [Methylococcaceae bacterium]|jgi:tetratricopeptide (TPR) repeat protein
MKKTTFVALLLLSPQSYAESLNDSLQRIESEWASIYYSTPKQNQGLAYSQLLGKTIHLSRQHPNNAEPIIWEAIVKATNADHQNAVSALESIHEARDLLLKAIEINPQAMDGSAYVTLGTLYYMAPKWPIGFGDEETAQKLLQTALKINPNGIESNYFYGDFLLSNNNFNEAEIYFQRALAIPARVEQFYADNQLKEQARIALRNTHESRISVTKGLFASVFNSDNTE